MTETSGDVNEVRAERDALRRELGDLRAHLCVALGILRREPGPEGLEVLEVVSDREILAAVRKLSVDAAPTTVGVDDRWSAVDRLILEGKKIMAIKQLREEYGGGIHEALDMLVRRYDRLRIERPDEFREDHKSYWSGFYS